MQAGQAYWLALYRSYSSPIFTHVKLVKWQTKWKEPKVTGSSIDLFLYFISFPPFLSLGFQVISPSLLPKDHHNFKSLPWAWHLAGFWSYSMVESKCLHPRGQTAHPGSFSSMAPLPFDYTPLFGEFSVLAHWGLKGTTLKSTSIWNEDSPKEKTTQHIAQVSPETYLQTSGEP